jgi:hypothetical protein
VADLLTGNTGEDWFLYAAGSDKVTDLKNADLSDDDLLFIGA